MVLKFNYSGQSIATSHDLGPQKVAFWKGNPFISEKSRLVKYDNLARLDYYISTLSSKIPANRIYVCIVYLPTFFIKL